VTFNYTFNVSDFEYLQDVLQINLPKDTSHGSMTDEMLKNLSNFTNNFNVLGIEKVNNTIIIEKNPLPPKNIIKEVNHELLEELARYDKKYEGLQQRYENLSRMYDNLDEELSSQHMFNKKLTSEMSEVMAMVHNVRELRNIVDQNNSIVSMLANRISTMNPPPYSQ
jgi:archaellum component FlaC